jgi:ATP-dependent Clp protease ATP-binding subunit ClpA
LNHAERTMAHVIAGIALRADAAERFNKCRVSSGAIQFGSSAVSLDSGRALQACLRYIEENVKSRSEERRVDLPLSQDVRDVLGRAQQIANEREQRQIEVGDILQAITEPELYSRMRHLLLGSSSPSLSDIAQDLRQIAFGIAEVRNSAVGPAFVDALTQMQAALQGHMTKFDDVVSATEPSRPFPAVHTSMFNEVRGVPDHGTIKLRNLSSALDEIRGGSQKQEEELDQIDGRIKALEGLCLKLMAIAGVSALAAVLLLGVVGYKSLT